MEEDTLELDAIIVKLQSQVPHLAAVLRDLKPEYKSVENIDALIVLNAGMGLLTDLLSRVDPEELMALLERSKFDSTVECLAIYGAMAILAKRHRAGAKEWVDEIPLIMGR